MENESKWQRQRIQDHKFDFVDIDEFVQTGLGARLSYVVPFVLAIKTCLMYFSDLWTTFNFVTNQERALDLYFGAHSREWFPYVFYISLLFSFLLVPYEMIKAMRILKSRDISCTYTNAISHRFYALTSYRNHCFFRRISEQRSLVDGIAFFVFFTLKGWKRLVLVNVPREAIKSYVLVRFIISFNGNFENLMDRISSFSSSRILSYTALGSLAITNVIFLFSALCVIVAALLYIPLAFHIRGNLKEYCCYKVDKRISKLLLKQVRKRQASVYRSRPEKSSTLPTPTLPSLTLNDAFAYDNRRFSIISYTTNPKMSSHTTSPTLSLKAHLASDSLGTLHYPINPDTNNNPPPPFQRLSTITSKSLSSDSRASSRQAYYRPPPKISVQRLKPEAARSYPPPKSA